MGHKRPITQTLHSSIFRILQCALQFVKEAVRQLCHRNLHVEGTRAIQQRFKNDPSTPHFQHKHGQGIRVHVIVVILHSHPHSQGNCLQNGHHTLIGSEGRGQWHIRSRVHDKNENTPISLMIAKEGASVK